MNEQGEKVFFQLSLFQFCAELLTAFALPYAIYGVRRIPALCAPAVRSIAWLQYLAVPVAAVLAFALASLSCRAFRKASDRPLPRAWWRVLCHLAAVLIAVVGVSCTLLM